MNHSVAEDASRDASVDRPEPVGADVLTLRPDVHLESFDSGNANTTYVVSRGVRHWRISAKARDIVMALVAEPADDHAAQEALLAASSPAAVDTMRTFLFSNGLVMESDEVPPRPTRNAMFWLRFIVLPSRVVGWFRPLRHLFRPLVAAPLGLAATAVLAYCLVQLVDIDPGAAAGRLRAPDLVVLAAVIISCGVCHELGHASGLMSQGQKPGGIGCGLYLIFPVLYAEVDRAWRVGRRGRVAVDAGGVYFQLLAMGVVLGVNETLWHDDVVNLAILLSSGTVVQNVNPFVRLDGYWLFVDLLGVPSMRRLRGLRGGTGYFADADRQGRSTLWWLAVRSYTALQVLFVVYLSFFMTRMLQRVVLALSDDVRAISAGDAPWGAGKVTPWAQSTAMNLIVLGFTARLAVVGARKARTLVVARRSIVDADR
jgi:hypothetical protein